MSYPQLAPIHYIDIEANLNMSIMHTPGGYEFAGATVDYNNPGFVVNYNLPTGSVNIDTGIINAMKDGIPVGGFSSFMNISADSNGHLTGLISITGSDITETTSDDPTLAQQAHWSHETKNVTSTSEDILSATISEPDVRAALLANITALEDMYNMNVISTWQFNILPIMGPNNLLDQYALDNGRMPPDLFMDGEIIVLQTEYNYEINVEDMNGVSQVIVPPTPIYARVTHQTMANPLL